MKNFKKIVLILIGIILLIGLSGFGYVYSKLNKMYVKDEVVKDIENTEEATIVDGITNILLVGTDGEYVEKGNRSDSVMLVTIDSKNKDIKLSSIARDTYVDIPGYSTEKLTHAYAYEGIDLLKEVFKENFDLDIDKYIAGYQTLAFSRIRYTDSAFHREARHREVAESAYKEFAQRGVDTYKRCADIVLNNTKTNISPIEMMNLAYTVLKINDKDIEQFQFPLEEHRKGHIISKQKGWVLEWDKEPNLEAWHKFIFGKE